MAARESCNVGTLDQCSESKSRGLPAKTGRDHEVPARVPLSVPLPVPLWTRLRENLWFPVIAKSAGIVLGMVALGVVGAISVVRGAGGREVTIEPPVSAAANRSEATARTEPPVLTRAAMTIDGWLRPESRGREPAATEHPQPSPVPEPPHRGAPLLTPHTHQVEASPGPLLGVPSTPRVAYPSSDRSDSPAPSPHPVEPAPGFLPARHALDGQTPERAVREAPSVSARTDLAGSTVSHALSTPEGSAPDGPPPGGPSRGELPPGGLVVLNLATAQDLARLPGVGPKRAQAIIELRERLGRFRRPTDLLRVKGIGPRSLQKMLPYLSLDPPDTLDSAPSRR